MLKIITMVLLSTGHFSNQNRVIPKIQHKDTTISLFNSSRYQLTLHFFNEEIKDEEVNNTIITFQRMDHGKSVILFRDSLFCMYPEISLQDFNNDGINDIMIFYSTGARANLTYHLYITNPKNHTLNRVNDFEKLTNPALDRENNIIVSVGLAGSNYYSFYRITSKYKLLNLGHSFEETRSDTTQFERAIHAILKGAKRY